MKKQKDSTPGSLSKTEQSLRLTDSQRTSRGKPRLIDFSQVQESSAESGDKFWSSRASMGLGYSQSKLFNLTTTPKPVLSYKNSNKIVKTESNQTTEQKRWPLDQSYAKVKSAERKGKLGLPVQIIELAPQDLQCHDRQINKQVSKPDLCIAIDNRVQAKSKLEILSPKSETLSSRNKFAFAQVKTWKGPRPLVKVGSVALLTSKVIKNTTQDSFNIQNQDIESENPQPHATQKNLTPQKSSTRSQKPKRSITGLLFTQRISPRIALIDIGSPKYIAPSKERSNTQKQPIARKGKQPQQMRKQTSQPNLLKTVILEERPTKKQFQPLVQSRQLSGCQSAKYLFQQCSIGPKSQLLKPEPIQMANSILSITEEASVSENGLEWLPLHQACISGEPILVDSIIRKNKICVNQLSNGFTALHLACQLQKKQVVERLLLAKARVDILTANRDSALHILAQLSAFNQDLWDLLVSFCADVLHVRNKQGKTAFELLPRNKNAHLPGFTQEHVRPANQVNSSTEREQGPSKPLWSSVQLLKTKTTTESQNVTVNEFQSQLSPVNSKTKPKKQPEFQAPIKSTQASGTKIKDFSKPHLIALVVKERGPEDFLAHQLLGTGSFGEVFLIERKRDQKLLAMKVLLKKRVREQNLQRYALTERNVMSSMGEHPFIVKLLYAFQTIERLYLVSDYAAGGDLSQYLEIEGCFTEEKSRLYLAEIVLALEALHAQNIIYRDLKPDNVVVGEDGHIMLTDFGLSREGVKRSDQGAKSFCGSYAYLAPEMVRKTGHGKTVDWYLLGVILYEMLTGMPPYYNEDKNELFNNILTKKLTFDDKSFNMSSECRNILDQLLQKDPQARLGKNGSSEIKAHPFFKNIDWDEAYKKKLQVPSAYLAEMALSIIKQQPFLVAGHPSTVGKPCPVDHPAYLKNWSFKA